MTRPSAAVRREFDTGALRATAIPSGAIPVAAIRTAAITNLGCKVNQSEMDAAARLLRERGVRLVDPHAAADLHIVNTCTVTSIADQKSRQAVRRARRANPDATIVVTGCSVEVDRDAFGELDARALLIGNVAKDRLLAELAALTDPSLDEPWLDRAMPTLSGVEPIDMIEPTWPGGATANPPGRAARIADIDGIADGRTIADRTIADRTRAFVKIQDGCSFHCTYCIIPRARGEERSLAPEAILAEVRRARLAGHREIVLTGINVGTYDGGWSEPGPRGSHVRSALTLAGLVRRILAETDVERIRLSSIEPQHIDDDLLDAWVSGAPRTLPHLHVPLQSGDDGVLRRMGRRYETDAYRGIVERARAALPGLALHADVIVGFPTEDDAAWERSLSFIHALDPAGLHVFRYSARAGTPATRMTGQVDEAVKKERAAVLLEFAADARARFARRQLGHRLDVLFESELPDGRWLGHGPNYVLVAARPPSGRTLGNAVGRIAAVSIDPEASDRLEGSLLAVDWPRRRPLPVVACARPTAVFAPLPISPLDATDRRSVAGPNGDTHGR